MIDIYSYIFEFLLFHSNFLIFHYVIEYINFFYMYTNTYEFSSFVSIEEEYGEGVNEEWGNRFVMYMLC